MTITIVTAVSTKRSSRVCITRLVNRPSCSYFRECWRNQIERNSPTIAEFWLATNGDDNAHTCFQKAMLPWSRTSWPIVSGRFCILENLPNPKYFRDTQSDSRVAQGARPQSDFKMIHLSSYSRVAFEPFLGHFALDPPESLWVSHSISRFGRALGGQANHDSSSSPELPMSCRSGEN